jgi:hypothetical protein
MPSLATQGRLPHGKSSIWSMQLETRQGRRRILTIAVEPTTRRIWQARRKCNALPSAVEKTILAMWAERERLTLSDDLRA